MPVLARALVWLAALFALPPLPPPDGAWRVIKQSEGVLVRTAPSGIKPPWGDAQGVIAAAPDAVLAHLLAFEEMTRHVPRLTVSRVLRRSDGEALVYFYLDLPWPIANRDYTARYRWRHDGDGSITITIEDANAEGPPPTDAVRVTLVRGAWRLMPASSGGTAARYLFLADFGGSLTQGIVDQTAWKEPLETFLGVRRAVTGR